MPRFYSIACALLVFAAIIAAAVFMLACFDAPRVAVSAAMISAACMWINTRIWARYNPDHETYKDLQNLRK